MTSKTIRSNWTRIGSQAISIAMIAMVLLSGLSGIAGASAPSNPAVKWDGDITNEISGADAKDIIVDSSGNVYVSYENSSSGGVISYDSSGSVRWIYSQSDATGGSPSVYEDHSVSMTDSGRLYFAYVDSGNRVEAVEINDSNGNQLNLENPSTNTNPSNYILMDASDGIHFAYRDGNGAFAHEYHDESLTQQGTANSLPFGPIAISAEGTDSYVLSEDTGSNELYYDAFDGGSLTHSGIHESDSGTNYDVEIIDSGSQDFVLSHEQYGDNYIYRFSSYGDEISGNSWTHRYQTSSREIGYVESSDDLIVGGDDFRSTSDLTRINQVSLSGYSLYITEGNGNNFASLDANTVVYWGQASSNFQTSLDSDNSPVVAGDTYTANVQINNTGSASGTQTVSMDVNGVQVDSQTVSLGANSGTTISLSWTTSTSDIGTNNIDISSANDTTSYSIQVQDDITSINLDIDNDQILDQQSTSYTVNGTDLQGNKNDVSSGANVTSDDSTIVSVNEATTTLTYQSDGSTVIRASYVNQSGQTLWSNKTVETDTPEVTLNLDKNPIFLSETGNYTVTRESFGNSVNISNTATVTSGNISRVTIDSNSLSYNPQNLGTVSITAESTVNGITYSDSVNLTIDYQVMWSNWDVLNGGERMVLIGSDWTFIYLFGAILSSTIISVYFKAPRLGVVSFAGLSIMGWPLGFIPNYVSLTIIIFLLFMFFVFDFDMGTGYSE